MLKQRVITALVLLVVAVWALFFAGQVAWVTLMLAVALISAWEWSQFARIHSKPRRYIYATAVGGMVLLGYSFDLHNWVQYSTLVLMPIVFLSVIRFQMSRGAAVLQHSWLNLLLGAVLIANFVLATIWLKDSSVWLLLLSLVLIWLMDTGAYFSGRRFGVTKLASYVSPGKTWEGVAGGMALAALVAAAFWLFNPLELYASLTLLPLLALVLVMTLITGLSVFGDLFESLMKRQVGVKDSGHILPGHGGLLDRIDSLLVAIPLFWLLWAWL